MRIAQALALVAAGLLIGVLLTGSIGAAQVRPGDSRLFFIDIKEPNSATSSLVFIRDNKSLGCWIGVDTRDQDITSIASAPAEACR